MSNEKSYKKEISLLRISIPFFFMVAINFIAPVINTLVVSVVPNNGAIFAEAVGVSSQISSMFSTLMVFATGGIGIIVGQLIGKKIEVSEIQNSIQTLVIIAFVFSLIIYTLCAALFPAILLAYLKFGSEQYVNALKYGELISLTIIISTFTGALSTCINSYGYSNLSSMTSILTILSDVSLTLIFVLVANIGVIGSALGTVISQILNLGVILMIFLKKVMVFRVKTFYFDKDILKKIIRVSAPISAEKINFTFSSLVMGILIAQMGMKFSGTFIDPESGTNFLNLSRTMIMTFSNFICIASIALSIGVEIIISRDIGSSNYEKARKEIKKSFAIALFFDVILAIALVFLRGPIIEFFAIGPNQIVIDNKELLANLIFVPLILMIFLQIGRTSNIIFLSGVRPSGNLKSNMIFSISIT
jgi:Na+-driven multidrug efflux pump